MRYFCVGTEDYAKLRILPARKTKTFVRPNIKKQIGTILILLNILLETFI